MNDLDLWWRWASHDLPLYLVATLCGTVLGIERRLHQGVAGIKTYALVCLGATAYMSSGHLVMEATGFAGDPTRVASQIITGIGFLGAGAILRGEGGVSGLTTAAGIWLTGAIGVLIGCDFPLAGATLTLLGVGTVVSLSWLERRLGPRRSILPAGPPPTQSD